MPDRIRRRGRRTPTQVAADRRADVVVAPRIRRGPADASDSGCAHKACRHERQ
jgi:hypothetical protein